MTSRGGANIVGRISETRVLDVARRHACVDRATLAQQAGLTPQAVTNVLARLTAVNLMERAGSDRSGTGKPSHLYRLRAHSRQAIGVQVTRHKMRLSRVDLRGTVRSRIELELPEDFCAEDVLARLQQGVAQMQNEVAADGGDCSGVGIGMIGPLDQAAGVVRDAHHVQHWADVPLRGMAEQALGLPVALEKDVTAAALGEAWVAGGASTDTAVIFIDDGVGAGLWLHGAIHRGAHTNSGEFGHTVVDLRGPQCVCRRRGCLEVMHQNARMAGDIEGAAKIIAVGALNLIESLDVDRVVLGGKDFLDNASIYLAAVRAEIERYRPAVPWRSVDIVSASYGIDFVAAGAGLGVLRSLYFDEFA